MAAQNKLQTATGIVGVGALALFGLSACDDGGGAEAPPEENGGVEEGGAEGGAEGGEDEGEL